MPEPVTPEETYSRYVELISDSLISVGEAIHNVARAEHMLKKVRTQQHTLGAEEISHAATTFRTAQDAMKKAIDEHARIEQSFMEFQEGQKT